MKTFIPIFFFIFSININAQTDFKAAAQAYENNDNDRALNILKQLETKIGANPKIESLRALTLDQSGNKIKAYNSVLRYFNLAGRNNDNTGNKDMENLEISLKKNLETELKNKEEEFKKERTKETNEIVNSRIKLAKETSNASKENLKQKVNILKQNITQDLDPEDLQKLITVDPDSKDEIRNKTIKEINNLLITQPELKNSKPSCDYCKFEGYKDKIDEDYYQFTANSLTFNTTKKTYGFEYNYHRYTWGKTDGEMVHREYKDKKVQENIIIKGKVTYKIDYLRDLYGSNSNAILLKMEITDNSKTLYMHLYCGDTIVEQLKDKFNYLAALEN